jgi:dipeptidyl aminopeptidase/acylaminoacyl peptidase
MTLAAGTKLGPYEILSPLGAGGMGEVYRARDVRLGREVAFKVLPEQLSADANRLARFEQEARSASALNHPNIVTVYEIGQADAVSYIAMELVDGSTIRELTAGGPMPIRKVLALGAQVAAGLAKAHGAGIVHRDLKPENLMVSRDGFLKILDFGLAKLIEPQSGQMSAAPTLAQPETQPGTVLGTVGYMSPEQASGQPLDFRSDQFSLGSILYEMTSGEKAFARKTAAETMSAIIREEPEPLARRRPEVPIPLRWIVERCLAKDPEERYASTRDLARDLVGVRDRISEVSGSAELLSLEAGRARERRVPLAAAAAIAAVALLAGWLGGGWRTVRFAEPPSFQRLTFRPGLIHNARFATDGQTILYSATWAGQSRPTLYQTRPDSPESRAFDFPDADIFAISSKGEMALSLHIRGGIGTLARVPMSGGAPREVVEGISYAGADWSPNGKDLAVVRNGGLEFPIGTMLYKGADVASPRFSPSGRQIAFVEGTAVCVIEVGNRKRQVLSKGWADISGVPNWSPDGKEVWFTAVRTGETAALHAVTLAGRERLVARVPGHLELDDIARDGRVLVAHHTFQLALAGRAPGEKTERELPSLDSPEPSSLSADGRAFLFTETGEGAGSGLAVYLGRTDGSPPVRLGDGQALALSPDGTAALTLRRPDPAASPRLVILPTGAGEARTVPTQGLVEILLADWLADGKQILVTGQEKGREVGVWVVDPSTGRRRAAAPEGILMYRGAVVSPDGRWFLGHHASGGEFTLFPVEAGQPRKIADRKVGERFAGWTADGQALYVYELGVNSARVQLLDIETGQRRVWMEMPSFGQAASGRSILMSRSGDAYVLRGRSVFSELYLVSGLK